MIRLQRVLVWLALIDTLVQWRRHRRAAACWREYERLTADEDRQGWCL